jgi:hypothetical protein
MAECVRRALATFISYQQRADKRRGITEEVAGGEYLVPMTSPEPAEDYRAALDAAKHQVEAATKHLEGLLKEKP